MFLKSIFTKRVNKSNPTPTNNSKSQQHSSILHVIDSTEATDLGDQIPTAQPDSEPEDEHIATEIDTSGWPPAIECDPEHPTTDPFLGNIKRTDDHLDIKVGRGKFVRRWRVQKDLMCRYSGYFRQVCGSVGTAEISFQETNEGVFDLHDDNPAAFELFLDWLYSNKNEPTPGIAYELTNWNLYPVEAYALGDKLMADAFRPIALKHVIYSARYFDRRDIEIAFELTGSHDPLYHFICRWLRWRCREDPQLWLKSHNAVLQTERQRQEPATSVAGKDPRQFFIQHWFELCCETSRTCEHQTAASTVTFYECEDDLELGKARLRRAWIRRKAYGYRRQSRSILVAYGLFVSALGF